MTIEISVKGVPIPFQLFAAASNTNKEYKGRWRYVSLRYVDKIQLMSQNYERT